MLRGTLILAGAYTFNFQLGRRLHEAPVPSRTYGPIPSAVVSLTIQAALPGTVLANGETIPSPGQSVIVKLFNDYTPNNAGAGYAGHDAYGSTGSPARSRTPGRASSSASMTASIRPATARWSIPVPTPSCESWAFPATRRPASSACR